MCESIFTSTTTHMHKCPLEGKSQKILFIISFSIPIHSLKFQKTEGKTKEGKKKETQKDVEIIFLL
jgi:hypothetical protein